MLEDLPVEHLQLSRGLDAELTDEHGARGLVVGERIRLPAAAVQGEHEQEAEPLAVRMLGNESLELRDRMCRPVAVDVGCQAALDRDQAQPRESRNLGPREWLVRHVRQRRPAPEVECRPRVTAREQCLEAIGVELLFVDAQSVAGAVGRDAFASEQLAQ